MAIFEKRVIDKEVELLEKRISELMETLKGHPPNKNIHHLYTNSPEDYESRFIEVDMQDLEHSVRYVHEDIKALKSLSKLKAEKLHNGR